MVLKYLCWRPHISVNVWLGLAVGIKQNYASYLPLSLSQNFIRYMKYKYFMNKFKIATWYGIQVPKGNVVNWKMSIGIVNGWVY